jgi:hypothetical protein
MGATPLAIRFGTCPGTTCDKNHRPRQRGLEQRDVRDPAHVRRLAARRLRLVKSGSGCATPSANGTDPRVSGGAFIFASARPM